MPTAIQVCLRSPADAHEPSFLDLHQLASWLLEPAGSGAHHDQRKPYSIWPLLPADAEDLAMWRLNVLDDESDRVDHLLRQLSRRPRLVDRPVEVVDVRVTTTPFADLAEARPVRTADLLFLSPTYFSRSGRDYLLPDPVLILRTLAARWNGYAPERAQIDEPARELLLRQAVLVAHELRTVRVDLRGGGRTGFVGQVRLGLPRRAAQPVSTATLGTLCRFVPFCGIGAMTTHGLGCVSAVPVDG